MAAARSGGRRGGRARLVRRLRETTDSLWFVPLVFCLAAVALGIGLPWLDHLAGPDGPLPFPFPASPRSGAQLIQVAAGALASLAAISFSMSMVTIQLAATQYTPRLLRNFMSDRKTQVLIGVTIGTVVFLVVLVPPTGAGSVPGISFSVALALSVLSLSLLPVYFHHVTRSVQASSVVTQTARRSQATLASIPLRCAESGSPPRAAPDAVVTSDRTGYLQVLEEDDLLEALPRGAVGRVEVAVGVFVLPGTPLLSVWGAGAPDEERVREAFAFSSERNHPQDVLFGVRQLVDIAVRALSPAMNDPTTAIMALNELGSLGAALVREGAPTRPALRRRVDGDRALWAPTVDVASFLEGTFDDVAAAVGAHGRVVVRMLEILTHLAATTDRSDLRALLLVTGARVAEIAERDGPLPGAWPERVRARLGELDLAVRGEREAPAPAPTIQ